MFKRLTPVAVSLLLLTVMLLAGSIALPDLHRGHEAGAQAGASTVDSQASLVKSNSVLRQFGQPGAVPDQQAVAVHGFGMASMPAEHGTLQFVIGAPYPVEGEPKPLVPPTEADLQPVTDALVAVGVPREAIRFETAPPMYSPADSAYLYVDVAAPTSECIKELTTVVTDTLDAHGMPLLNTGVLYETSNCDDLENQARAAGIADAESRAERLAASLGVSVGEFLLASESPAYDPYGSSPCAQGGMGYEESPGYWYPPIDPARGAEVHMFVDLNMTFAVE